MRVARDSEADEVALAERARTGDSDAFAAIVTRYQGPVLRACSRYLGSTDAQDAAQEAFVRAFVHRESFDPSRPLLPWLLVIARRLCLDRLRKKTPELDSEPEAHADSQPDAESSAAAREEIALLRRGLADLPEGPREAVVRYHLEGMSYEQIASSLEVPLGTVMTWLHRGRARLRSAIDAAHRASPMALGGEG